MKVHEEMRIEAVEAAQPQPQPPYLTKTVTKQVWNPNFNQDALCHCGHPYYRHFDSYDDMEPIGCKYCDCLVFAEDKG